MKALVVFESLYGNTAAVGEVVAGSRSRGYDVTVGSVSIVSPAENWRLARFPGRGRADPRPRHQPGVDEEGRRRR